MPQLDGRVLVVDDDPAIRESVAEVLEVEGLTVAEADGGDAALNQLRATPPDVLLLDMFMPGTDGRSVLKQCRSLCPGLPVVVLTGHGSIQDAVETVKEGAFWYLTKPCSRQQLLTVIGQALRDVTRQRRQQRPLSEQLPLLEVMGEGPRVVALVQEVKRVAPTDFSVMLIGETGVGKEVVARAIHLGSRRAAAEFVAVDSGAIPETLVESELFGHERGAFTGADRMRAGKFELASGGTLLLDEIGNLPFSMQGKLLRVLQERRYYRVGGTRAIDVDVRVISATNHDLGRAESASAFRTDLFHRLSEYVVRVPPLRERREDVAFLARRFLDLANQELGKQVADLTPAAVELLERYDWPGNVRELRNVVRRATLLADAVVGAEHLSALHGSSSGSAPPIQTAEQIGQSSLWDILRQSTAALEAQVLRQALERAGGNKAEAARLLRVDYKTFHTKAKRYGLGKV